MTAMLPWIMSAAAMLAAGLALPAASRRRRDGAALRARIAMLVA